MPRKQPPPPVADDDGDDPDLIQVPVVEQSDAAAEIEDLIGQVVGSEEPIVKVTRRKPTYGYVGQLPVTEGMMLEEEIAQWAGGGTYICQFFARLPGELRRRPVRGVTVVIAGAPRDPKRAAAERENGTPGVAGGDVELRLQLAKLEGKLEGMQAGAGAGAALDPIGMLEKLSTIMHNTASPAVNPTEQMGSILALVEKVVGVGREIAPEETRGGTDWSHVVDRATEAIGKLIDENRAQRLAAPVVPAGEAPPQLPPGMETAPMWQQEVASWVPKLTERAIADKDPGVAADVFLEDVSPATVQALRPLAAREDFVTATLTQLAIIEPRTKDLGMWFTEFLTAVQAALAEEGSPVIPPGAPVQ